MCSLVSVVRNSVEVYCDPRSLLDRIRFNSDYAEVFVKPRSFDLACAA
jgi:hypothetical protein